MTWRDHHHKNDRPSFRAVQRMFKTQGEHTADDESAHDESTSSEPGTILCSICLESLQTSTHRQLCCGHVFHDKCLHTYLQKCGTSVAPCPLCREPFKSGGFAFAQELLESGRERRLAGIRNHTVRHTYLQVILPRVLPRGLRNHMGMSL